VFFFFLNPILNIVVVFMVKVFDMEIFVGWNEDFN